MKTRFHGNMLFLLFMSFGLTVMLAACGGGGGGGTPSPGSTASTATITGQVLGSTFEAFDANTGALAGQALADPNTKIFSMQLATGKNYKFYLVENEGTSFQRSFPLFMFNSGQNRNIFSIGQAKTINLGFMDIASGATVPALGLSQMQTLGMDPASFDSTVPSALSGTTFGPGDMAGAWNVHGIADNSAWFHGSMTIGSAGSISFLSPVSNNSGFGTALGNRSISFFMTQGGVINSPSDTDFNGFMSFTRNMFISTDIFSGAHELFFAQKAPASGTTFGMSDLAATWQVQGIIDGPGLNGWMQGPVTFDSSGNITSQSMFRNNGTQFTFTGTAAINASTGEITFGTTFHGTMNQDKDRIMATLTDGSGDACLLLLQKFTNTSHTNADLGGTWYMHNVAVGAGGRTDFGPTHFDTSGNATMERFSTNPAFTNTPSNLVSFSMTMNAQGVMSGMNGFPGMMGGSMMVTPGQGGMGMMGGSTTSGGFSGFMDSGNGLFINNMTNTQGGTNWNMLILQK